MDYSTLESSFQDKVYLISGGNSGIGLATAQLLLKYGAKVSIGDLSGDEVDESLESLAKGSSMGRRVDVGKRKDVDSWVEDTVKQFGRIDGAVNCAGIPQPKMVPTGEVDDETWTQVMDVNLNGMMNCVRAEVKNMETGAIVNVASLVSQVGLPCTVAYTASKHGVIGLTRAVAREYGEKGIRINAVSPGFTRTPMTDRGEDILGYERGTLPPPPVAIQKRYGKAHEIARPILFLLSDWASFIDGQNYCVDGGWVV